MALFPHPDRSREASLEMLQTLRRIAPSKSLLAGTLAARCWNRSTTSFGSREQLLLEAAPRSRSRDLSREWRASFEGGLSVIALFHPSATRERCFETEKMLSVATNKRRVLLCTLRAESNLASMAKVTFRSHESSDKRAMRWMSLTRPVSPRCLRSGFELSLSP